LKTLYSLVFLTFFFLCSCQNEAKVEEPKYIPVNLPKEEEPKEVGFYCPMKCEGEKVYQDKKNKCPVCDMALIHTK
jgi:hypothetical protein